MNSDIRLWKPLAAVLGGIEIAVGATALFAGIALIADPSGRFLGLSLTMLSRTPFPSFLVPGIALLIAVGVLQSVAGGWTLSRHKAAVQISAIAGLVVTGWSAIGLLLGIFAWEQVIFFVLGPAEVILAGQLRGPQFNRLRA